MDAQFPIDRTGPTVEPRETSNRTRPAAKSLLRFERVTKAFSGLEAVSDFSLEIFGGEFFALLGASGCGKTTLLRLIAGFETPDRGRILLDGEDLAGVPPHRRPVNMMFQSYALFPHLNVARNVGFGLKQDRLSKAEIAQRVRESLALVRLDGLDERKPHQLSGGQQQRVALARALAKRPRVLLLDEPMAALDKKLREETQFELMHLRERLGLTFVIVTHDQSEAMTVADRICVMDKGRLVQVAPPLELYEQPVSRWVASFVGNVNLLEGRLAAADDGILVIESAGIGRIHAVPPGRRAQQPGVVWVALRPEKINLLPQPPLSIDANCAPGRVSEIAYRGDQSIYTVLLDSGIEMRSAVANRTRLMEPRMRLDDRVWLSWTPDACIVLTH